MNDLNNFKMIADELMKDIRASNELKEKTLRRFTQKRGIPIYKILVPTACLGFLLGILGILAPPPQVGDSQNPGVNILVGTGEGIQTEPRILETYEEAKTYFGDDFLIPSYIPEKFKLDQIRASGSQGVKATKVVIDYLHEDLTMMIIEEKILMQNQYIGYKQVDVKGFKGYLKSEPLEGSEKLGLSVTEIHWVVNDVQYSVMGLLTEDEAVKVALSLK